MTPPLRKSTIALALLSVTPGVVPDMAWGQQLTLRSETTISGVPDRKTGAAAPVYIEADRVQGHAERETEASGNARARARGQLFSADWLRFDHKLNEITAIGNVHFEQAAYVLDGMRLRYDLDSERGVIEGARFALNPRETGNVPVAGAQTPFFTGRGSAERIVFDGPGIFRAQLANFTTCEPGRDGWAFRARDLEIYQQRGVGVARGATVELEGVPVFYTPYLSFPLQQERKSGFLAPRFGSTSVSGFEVSAPYFLNLAPNYDLTLTPRALTRRGLQVNSQFRYLQPDYRGQAFVEVLPGDRLADRTRTLYALTHRHTLWGDWLGTLDLNRVSDPKYFTDLSTKVALTSQSFLSRQATIERSGSWGANGTYALGGVVQGWQTLQNDPLVPLTPPYSRRPQLTFAAQNDRTFGGQFDFQSSYVDFRHPTLPTGRRLVAYPSFTLPLQSPAFYFTPKVGMHLTRYWLDPDTNTRSHASRTVPIFTATTGVTFERDTTFFGKTLLQTLEPKAYYVYIPFREQKQLPNFDSGVMDINFATIFAENQFSGADRINDAQQLTLGASSRLINPVNGFEVVRGVLAQRYYFRGQDVTVPNVPARSNQSTRSDLLAAVSGTVAPNVSVDLGWQYNTDTLQTQRSSLALRYAPQAGKVLNLSYRQNVPSAIRQFDISGQWPVARNWHAVGRWNYSVPDKRLLEGLAGMEYDGGCYKFRFVAHRVSTATTAANTAIYLELELNGVTRVGSNSLDLLRRNVGGYTRDSRAGGRVDPYVVPE